MTTTEAPAIPDHDELVRRALELKPKLRARSAQVEAAKTISAETVEELEAAGFFRMTSPKRFGGWELPGRTRTEILSVLAAGDASTAWVVGVYSGGAAGGGSRNPQAQEALFANGPDVKICGSGTPTKDVQKVDGGYRVSGRWFSVSGALHADWASLFLDLTDESGRPGMGKALVPLSDLTVQQNWDATGMRGTESETLVADSVFVPEHLVEQLDGPPKGDPTLSVGPCAVPLGIAQGALDLAVDYGTSKPLAGTIYSLAATSTTFQIELADAAMLIDSARLHLFRATEDIDRMHESGEPMELLLRARCRGDAGWTMKCIVEAIEKIMTAVGSGAFSQSSPFERAWRDVSTLSRHGAVNSIINREIYGKVLLGQDGNISRLPV